ncbi:hypothetical protein FLONG3_3571 [Fusarium longipes]|uniref:Zn(2)-C6 fungal-type domain-containing protein n=1 Tax=Fusarium longipes TaxID=694270 RepID=A0A395T1A0_9HYPO|nr:hypothetical protein FLONG3_3571 [Fusarium longipes]
MSGESRSSQSPQAPSGSESDLGVLSPFSCQLCRMRKLKCDKALPRCGRCAKTSEKCDYPSARKKPVINPAMRPKLRDMQTRIRDLEARLESQNSPPEHQAFGAELIDTGRFERLPPPNVVDELTTIYFTKLQSDSFMIHGERYIASLYRPTHMQPPMCLQYAILAAGASASQIYGHMAEAFYVRARQYIQADEMKSDSEQISLAHCQAWVLIGHFEAQHLWFSRASMSIARAIRLAHILGLHRLDGKNAAGLTLPPALDFTEEEERRKTFWVVFTTDRITSSTGGWPTMMDWRSIQTRLPTSIDAFLSSTPVATITLKQALGQGMYELSTSACRVVAVHLFNECFNFSRASEEDEDNNDWDQLQKLDEAVTNAFATLPLDLRCPENIDNPAAVLINLQLHTALICIHRSVTTRSQMDMSLLPHINSRVMESALQIMMTVALVSDLSIRFRNPLVSFATFVAASFFLTDFSTTGNRQSEDNFTALMSIMTEVGKTNMFAASLAVRLVQNLKASAIDQGTIGTLLAELNMDAPIPGQEDEENGIVVLCPVAGTPEQVGLEQAFDFKLYRYTPSLPAAIVSVVVFAILTAAHIWRLYRVKAYYFTAFTIGGLFQTIGYIGRIWSHFDKESIGGFVIQAILILVAPALYAASIYMILGRLIRTVGATHLSLIPVQWVTRIFVTGDVIAFGLQAGGGGIQSAGTLDMYETGEKIIIAGLFVQIVVFGFFVVTSFLFHYRLAKSPTTESLQGDVPWKRYLYVLYASSFLILVRSIFRVVEYLQGNKGYLISHEVFLYVFDAILMALVMLILSIWYVEYLQTEPKVSDAENVELSSYDTSGPNEDQVRQK